MIRRDLLKAAALVPLAPLFPPVASAQVTEEPSDQVAIPWLFGGPGGWHHLRIDGPLWPLDLLGRNLTTRVVEVAEDSIILQLPFDYPLDLAVFRDPAEQTIPFFKDCLRRNVQIEATICTNDNKPDYYAMMFTVPNEEDADQHDFLWLPHEGEQLDLQCVNSTKKVPN